MGCQHLKITKEHKKIQTSPLLKKFRISGNTRSSFLSDNVLRYRRAAAVPFGQPHLLQISADTVVPYDSCTQQTYSFLSFVKLLHAAAFKAPSLVILDNLLSVCLAPTNCLNHPLYLGDPASFCLPSTVNVFINTFLMHPTRHALSFFSIFIISYNLFYGIIFVYFELWLIRKWVFDPS